MAVRIRVPAVLVLFAAALAVGCSPQAQPEPDSPNADKQVEGELRTETEPLVGLLPSLTGIDSATWLAGTWGSADSLVPGPTDYWVDAVVALPADVAQNLRQDPTTVPADGAPEVVADLEPYLPDGDLLQGEAIDEFLTRSAGPEVGGHAFLKTNGDLLVFSVTY